MTTPSKPGRTRGTAFGGGIPLGRYGGVRVTAHWSVLVILALLTEMLAYGVLPSAAPRHATGIYLATALGAAAVFLGALLAHEVAHAVIARHYRMPVKRITLWMLGGMTELNGDPPSPRADAAIAAAGPATSIALGGVFGALAWLFGGSGLIGAALVWLAAVSLLLGVFNLLPGAPLDGGRLLRAALWHRYGDRARAADVSARVGRAMGMIFVVLGVLEFFTGAAAGLWMALIGWFVISGASGERYAALIERLRGRAVRDVMAASPVPAQSWLTLSDFVSQLTTEHAAAQRVFAVVGLDGEPEGVLLARDLERVPPHLRATTRVRDIRRTRLRPLIVSPDALIADIVAPTHLRGGVAVVVENRRVVGTLTEADLVQAAANLASFGRHEDSGVTWQR
jgi:Zn-dependent protease